MSGKTKIIAAALLLVSACSAYSAPSSPKKKGYLKDADGVRVDKAMEYYTDYYWSPRTGLVYTCLPENVRSSDDCVNGMFHWYQGIPGGYGQGMGDCALIMGTALSGMVDKWDVVTDQNERSVLQKQAEKLARGMLNLASLHGIKGFVARGICVDDARSICSLSSIDQYTHWEHSLIRYALSGMASAEFLKDYRRIAVEVASFMEERVTEENGWNFGLADGTIPDPRGICTMWGPDKKAHAAARLPMLYIATYLATGDEHWRTMYERYIDRALEMTVVIKDQTEEQIKPYMPCYAFYQAMCSLEVIAMHENAPARVALVQECMDAFAAKARFRAENADEHNPPYGMCWDGELILSKLMNPAYNPDEADEVFFREALSRKEPLRMGWCRAAHIYAAYWRSESRNKHINK